MTAPQGSKMLAHWTGVLLARRAPRGEHAGLLAALGLT